MRFRRLLIKVILWTLKREAKAKGWNLKWSDKIADEEISAAIQNWRERLIYGKGEAWITAERLDRRFDLGMTLNEVANRAIASKAEARKEQIVLSSRQLAALKAQEEYLACVVRGS